MMPHYICPFLSWKYIVWMTSSDVLVWMSYFILAVLIVNIGLALKKRLGSLPFGYVGWAFALFIFLCGKTHLCRVLALWFPYWWLYLTINIATAVVSAWTARLLWKSKNSIVDFIAGRLSASRA